MTDTRGSAARRDRLREALAALRQARLRLEAVEQARREPIAVVGLGCRFPAAASPEEFWELLVGGVDAVTEVPPERWDAAALYDPDPTAPGKTATRWGAFLDDVTRFDAAFFGIAPREAAHMDPQQRLLLEVAYTTLEDAGLPFDRVDGSPAGVFVGLHNHSSDYALLQLTRPDGIDTYTATGTAMSIAANRLSYALGLQGPSLAVDTACSSSLVAVHLACQSLRSRDCDLALAGGVNLMLVPETTIAFSKMQMLAPDGRCKTFDVRADGFVRGEGCALVALKRLSDALADGDRIRAVIRGTAVNSDGRTNGLTAPNGLSQQAVVRAALAAAGVDPSHLGYVETHGTGTALGDPIEVEALAAVVGTPRPGGAVCALGSVKTNLGHLEGAAGIAGLVKAVLALEHEAIPPNLHFQTLNPHIDFGNAPFVVPTEVMPWPDGSGRVAGVSSFGWGGTNAHAVVGEAPQPPADGPAGDHDDRVRLLPLSARCRQALRALAAGHRERLDANDAALADVCYTAGARRTHHEHRLAVVGRSRDELTSRLDAYLADQPRAGVAVGTAPEEPPGLVFAFSGQGPQLAPLNPRLLDAAPAFQQALERCDAALGPLAGWSMLEQLTADTRESRLDRPEVAQPALVTIQVALASLWASWGILPDAVVGHSLGELAAAHVAGALDLPDTLRAAFERGRILQAASGGGRMAAAGVAEADAVEIAAAYGERLVVASVNSPTAVVFAGEPAAVEEVVADLEARGAFARLLAIDYASHSPHMETPSRRLTDALAGIVARPPSTPIVSTVTGRAATGTAFDAAYWGANLRSPVRFATAVDALAAEGHTCFLELGHHPSLGGAITETLGARGLSANVHASLRRGQDEETTLLTALGGLYALGRPVRWDGLYPEGGRLVALPRYPFQGDRYWVEGARSAVPARTAGGGHPLLGQPLRSPALAGTLLTGAVAPDEPAFLGDHRVWDTVVLPVASMLDLCLAAAQESGAAGNGLGDIVVHQPLVVEGRRDLQVIVDGEGNGDAAISVYAASAGGSADDWTLQVTGRTLPDGTGRPTAPVNPAAVAAACGEDVAVPAFYDALARRGMELGPAFRALRRLRRGQGQALADLTLASGPSADAEGWVAHPVLVDAALQTFAAAWPAAGADEDAAYLPVSLDRVRLSGRIRGSLTAHARVRAVGGETLTGDVTIWNSAGDPVLQVDGLVVKRAARAALHADGQAWRGWLHRVTWQRPAEPAATANGVGSLLVVADAGGVGSDVVAGARRLSGEARLVAGVDQAETALAAGQPPDRVVFLAGLDAACDEDTTADDAQGRATTACAALLRLVRALAAQARPSSLAVVTRGAQRTGGERAAPEPLQAALWGLGRVVALEHAELASTLVDLDPDAGPAAETLLATVLSARDEDQIAIRGEQRLAARLTREPADVAEPVTWRPNATYLITGGLGGLGLEVARRAAARGAGHLVLVGRRALEARDDAAERAEAIAAIERLGATVTVAATDVGDASALAALLDRVGDAAAPLRGVIHAAGVVDHCPTTELDDRRLAATLRPKLAGAWALHRATRHLELDFFVVFSSTTALLGAQGFAHYAAANEFLGALAERRRALGLPCLAIDWGLWEETRALDPAAREAATRSGLVPMPPARALDALDHLLAGGPARTAVAAIDWPRLRAAYEARRRRAFLDIVDGPGPDDGVAGSAAGSGSPPGKPLLRARLEHAAADERRNLLVSHVQAEVAAVLGVGSPDAVATDTGFFRMGMDSLTSIELKTRLETAVGRPLPPSVAFNYPTVEGLAEHLASLLPATAPAPATAPPPAADLGSSADGEAASAHSQLSDDELVALLARKLTEIKPEPGGQDRQGAWS